MCLIVFAVNAHPDYKLILAANRDEFYKRPTSVADYWTDHPSILGGRDLEAAGTWMAVNKGGHFGAVTNFRDLKNIREDAKSRGDLVVNYLIDSKSAEDYLENISLKASDYNGFNLLLWDGSLMSHFSNYEGTINTVENGIHGLSNALLDTPWPKVEKLKNEFSNLISSSFNHDDLLKLLQDESLADDNLLPNTGIDHELEKMLSAICIKSEKYGTCCSTILTISNDGMVEYTEKSFPVGKRQEEIVSYKLQV
ncbi:MAG: NRDE family protein [Cytophagales bacterium]|nr:NRDE family protein [Cytophagales bacterium]